MPVTGLPVAAEAVLSSLLSTHGLSSWKVAGKNQTTVVVLRFQQDGGRPFTASENSHGHWRRKPPAQIRRDQQRALERRLNGEHNVVMTLPPVDEHCVIADSHAFPCATVSSCAPVSCSARGNQADIKTDCLPTSVTSDLAFPQEDISPEHRDLDSIETTDSKNDQNGENLRVDVDANDAIIHEDAENAVDSDYLREAFESFRLHLDQDLRGSLRDALSFDGKDQGVIPSSTSPVSMPEATSSHGAEDVDERNRVPVPESGSGATQGKEAKGGKSPTRPQRDKRRRQPQRTVRRC